jgi:alanyl-tRNA synthetase
LRETLGDHVKQQGSLVGPDRLRFDFSHYEALSDDEIFVIEDLVATDILANTPARHYETTKDKAEEIGAIAFFGDKYGDMVRVLEAGKTFELCGGTHVKATGDIGIIKVVSESSIGSNLRRIEAVTGENTFNYLLETTRTLSNAAELLGTQPSDIMSTVQRKLDEVKSLSDEIKQLRSAQARSRAGELVAQASNGHVVARVDGISPNDLRELALAIRQSPTVQAVVLGGVTDTGGVALVAAVGNGLDVAAGELIKDAAKAVGGGGGGKGDIATAGGKNPAALDEALNLARAALGRVSGS